MAEGVVDDLEAIEVEKEDVVGRPAHGMGLAGHRRGFEEGGAVHQLGQAVMAREELGAQRRLALLLDLAGHLRGCFRKGGGALPDALLQRIGRALAVDLYDDAGMGHFEVDRLGDVVVGAALQGLDHVVGE